MVGKEHQEGKLRNVCDEKKVAGRPRPPAYRRLDASDITHLQRIYPEIIDDLKDSFLRLKDPQTSWRMARAEERRILRALASLQPLTNVKSSIFLLRGLKPSIFTLLFEVLPLTDEWIVQNAPDCHYALLRLAFAYAQIHDHFMMTSDILTAAAPTQTANVFTPASATPPHHQKFNINQQPSPASHGTSTSTEQQTRKHFARVLATMATLLSHQFHVMTAQAQSCVVDWLLQLTALLADHHLSRAAMAFNEVPEVFALRAAMLDVHFHLHHFKWAEQRKAFVKCMYRLQAFQLLLDSGGKQQHKFLLDQFVSRLIQAAGQLGAEHFRMVWTRTPAALLIKLFGLLTNGQIYLGTERSISSSSNISSSASIANTVAIATAAVPKQQPLLGPLNMEAFEFQLIADFLLDRKPICMVQDEELPIHNWIQSVAEQFGAALMHQSSQAKASSPEATNQMATAASIENGQPLQLVLHHWHFIVGQLALFCIVNRMRTPVGRNPLETFTKFESEIRSLVTQVIMRKPPSKQQIAPQQRQQQQLAVEDVLRSSTGRGEEMDEDDTSTTRIVKEDDREEQQQQQQGSSRNSEIVQSNRTNVERQMRPEEDWFRVRMLLHCIDQMDKQMVYAVHGSMLDIASDIPLNSRQFFSVNQVSCSDWLLRTTLPMMGVAFSNGNFAQIVRMAGFLFAEIERKHGTSTLPIHLDSSTLFAICWLIRALVELGTPQAIHGVRCWAECMFGTEQLQFEWCKYAELLAAARVEEALDGFLSIQLEQRTAFATHQTQTPPSTTPPILTTEPVENGSAAKVPTEQQHHKSSRARSAAKAHDCMLKTVEELAWRAASVLRNPQIGQRLYDSYVQKRISITKSATDESSEAQKHFKRIQWKRMIALSQWDQLDGGGLSIHENSAEHKFLPWESRGRLLDAETEILRLFELRQRKDFAGYGRMNTGEALYALQDDLSDTAQFLLLGGTEHADGLEHARLAFLHALCTGVQHLHQQQKGGGGGYNYMNKQQQQRSPNKQHGNAGLPVLLEFDLADLMRDWKSETLHRLELGQAYASWMQRLYGGQKEHGHALRKMHRDMAQLAQESGNPQLASLHLQLAGISTADTFVLSSSVNFAAGSNDYCMLSSSSAPQQQQIPSYDVYDGGPGQFIMPVEQQAFMPNAMAPPPPGFAPIAMNSSQQQQTAFHNYQSPIAAGTFHPQQQLNNNLMNPQNFMAAAAAQGASQQVLLSEEFDGDTVRLLPAEAATMVQFGIAINTEQGRRLETLIGQLPTYEEFCQRVSRAFPITDMLAAPFLDAIAQPAFQQFWLGIKHRQYRLYELALNSHLRFLENLFPGKSHVQTVEVILRLLKMLAQQPEWFVRIVSIGTAMGSDQLMNNDAWMDRIAVDVWTGSIPQLFAYLNNPKPIVRNIVTRLLAKIGQHLPHAICYPAIVIADQQVEAGSSKGLFSDNILWSRRLADANRTDMGEEDLTNKENFNIGIEAGLHNLDIGAEFADECKQSFSSPHLIECCRALVASLSESHPQLINDTRAFCRALQRIALLHEEQWLYVLGQFDQQLGRLFRGLASAESSKITERVRKYLEKMLASLRTLYSHTCGCPELLESENERQFAADFGEKIHNALETFEQQITAGEGGNPVKAWDPFRKILSALNKQAMKRASLCLSVSKMSTYLAELGATAVPMPGQDAKRPFGEVVTVQRMTKLAQVLPTKTRPKKIAFTGSDGKTYAYLFKGQENLYMDARLMQLLRLCNAIFDDAKNQRQMDVRPTYGCITYSVTPLGQRSGLIQWVDGSVPLFQIYRKWRVRQSKFMAELEESKQQKIAAAAAEERKQMVGPSPRRMGTGRTNAPPPTPPSFILDKNNGRKAREESPQLLGQQQKQKPDADTVAPTEPERPIEQFYNRLKAAFALKGISKEQLADRQRWPRNVVKKVLKELVEETPKDILAKELWMHAGTSAAWWTMIQQFARTAAVGSMLGALIGLGDRHLDNVLVNMSSGQIVHVDYNVCFGKGRTLRVPEVVPFRLTGNIAHALGPTRIEGTFRQSSERVLEMLRADRQVLLQLLETFKSDPMLDFTFLQNASDLAGKAHGEIAAEVVRCVHRKLLGHELVYQHRKREEKTATADGKDYMEKGSATMAVPGMFKLAVMAAMSDGDAKAEEAKQQPKADQPAAAISNGAKTSSSSSQDWVETEQMSVKEQVDLLIQEATDLSNLALMYEGWTAWV